MVKCGLLENLSCMLSNSNLTNLTNLISRSILYFNFFWFVNHTLNEIIPKGKTWIENKWKEISMHTKAP